MKSDVLLFCFCLLGNILPVGNVEVNPVESLTQLSEEGSVLSTDDITLQDFDTNEDVYDTEGNFFLTQMYL